MQYTSDHIITIDAKSDANQYYLYQREVNDLYIKLYTLSILAQHTAFAAYSSDSIVKAKKIKYCAMKRMQTAPEDAAWFSTDGDRLHIRYINYLYRNGGDDLDFLYRPKFTFSILEKFFRWLHEDFAYKVNRLRYNILRIVPTAQIIFFVLFLASFAPLFCTFLDNYIVCQDNDRDLMMIALGPIFAVMQISLLCFVRRIVMNVMAMLIMLCIVVQAIPVLSLQQAILFALSIIFFISFYFIQRSDKINFIIFVYITVIFFGARFIRWLA